LVQPETPAADERDDQHARASRARYPKLLEFRDSRIERITHQQPEHQRDEHGLRVLQQEHRGNDGKQRDRRIAHVDWNRHHRRRRVDGFLERWRRLRFTRRHESRGLGCHGRSSSR
jgi:hypothetical protein